MWKACLGQLSELQQQALNQALEVESWLKPQSWTRAKYSSVCRSHKKTARKPRATSRDFLRSFAWNAPLFCSPPLPWKLKGSYSVSNANKQTRQNTPRLTVYNGDNTSCFSIFGWRLWTLKSWRKIAENWRNCNGEKWRTEIRIRRRKKNNDKRIETEKQMCGSNYYCNRCNNL